MGRDQRTDLDTNWVAWLSFPAAHVPGGETRAFGTVRCCSVGVPIPLFTKRSRSKSPTEGELAAAVGWLSQRNVPFWVTALEPVASAVEEMADATGLVFSGETMPGMATDLRIGIAARTEEERLATREALADRLS